MWLLDAYFDFVAVLVLLKVFVLVCVNPGHRGGHKPVHSKCWSRARINGEACIRKSIHRHISANSNMWIIKKEISILD